MKLCSICDKKHYKRGFCQVHHKQAISEYGRIRYLKNRDKILAYNNKYQKEHKKEVCEQVTRYNTRLRTKALKIMGEWCVCCNTVENLTIDHIVPIQGKRPQSCEVWKSIVKGNTSNLQVLCQSCNSSKDIGSHCKIDHF